MIGSSIVLVGCEAGEESIAIHAARSLFAEAVVTVLADLDQLFARDALHCDREFVVIAKGTVAQVARAIHAADDLGLPRWGVVVVGETAMDDAAVFVPRQDWNVRSAMQILRSTAMLHAARRENARLRGEHKTIATRFSHDVRGSLGAIFTGCQLIKEMDTVPDAALLHAITSSAGEISRLVERIALVLRATEAANSTEVFAMSEVVFRSLQRLEYECREKQVSIVVPKEWPTVRGVVRNLEVVWDCLLENAMKYGGNPSAIRLGWDRSTRGYEFWIEDSGTVPVELQQRTFQPLHTLHSSREGTGLDLAIVQRLVELDGGQCGFEPLPAGSRFRFTLPFPDE